MLGLLWEFFSVMLAIWGAMLAHVNALGSELVAKLLEDAENGAKMRQHSAREAPTGAPGTQKT